MKGGIIHRAELEVHEWSLYSTMKSLFQNASSIFDWGKLELV